MADKSREAVMVMLLNEPIDSDGEKPTSGNGEEKKMNISFFCAAQTLSPQ